MGLGFRVCLGFRVQDLRFRVVSREWRSGKKNGN